MCVYNESDLKKMLLIRNVELTILRLFSEGKIKGTTHTCLGQEYIPVALSYFMRDDDFIISNHRGHGHYLAISNDVEGLLSEIMDKDGSICNGIGGSQHLLHNNFMSTGVQGEGIGVGVGIAWTYKHEHTDNVCFTYIGDGTFGRGSVYESLNLASIYKLPLVIIVENNAIAMTTFSKNSMAGNVEARAKAFNIDYEFIKTHDLHEIRIQLEGAINKVRKGNGPLLIEFETQRVGAHSKGDDTRSQQLLEEVQEKYWYNKYLENNEQYVHSIEDTVKAEIDAIVNRVMNKGAGRWSYFEK